MGSWAAVYYYFERERAAKKSDFSDTFSVVPSLPLWFLIYALEINTAWQYFLDTHYPHVKNVPHSSDMHLIHNTQQPPQRTHPLQKKKKKLRPS